MSGRIVRFELAPAAPGGPNPVLLLNQILKLRSAGGRVRGKPYMRHRSTLCGLVKLATQGQRPAAPFARARIRVERHCSVLPDHDGLIGGLKPLIDVLRAMHPQTNPNGLDIIADDKPELLQLDAVAVKVRRSDPQKTVVLIEEVLDAAPA